MRRVSRKWKKHSGLLTYPRMKRRTYIYKSLLSKGNSEMPKMEPQSRPDSPKQSKGRKSWTQKSRK